MLFVSSGHDLTIVLRLFTMCYVNRWCINNLKLIISDQTLVIILTMIKEG